MSVKSYRVYTCDICGKELPEEYKNTDGEGGTYFMADVYNEVRLKQPVKDCRTMRVKVTLGGKDDKVRYTDVCTRCKLSLLKVAVAELEEAVGEQIPGQVTLDEILKESADNEREEADV